MAEIISPSVAGQQAITPDDHSDEGFVESSSASLLSTVPSEVTRLREEHGRLFANYGKVRFLILTDRAALMT